MSPSDALPARCAVTVVSRYPLLDLAAWKRGLIEDLLVDGADVSLLYSRSSLPAHGRMALGELSGATIGTVLGRVRAGGLDGDGRRRRRGGAAGAGSPDRSGGPTGAGSPHVPGDARRTSVRTGPRSLARWARSSGLRVERVERLDSRAALEAMRRLGPDVVLLAGADLVPPSLLGVPQLTTINPHYGLLPRYRGMNVTEWSVYYDDPVGVTVHAVDAGVDTGDILLREPVEVEPVETLASLRAKHQRMARRLLRQAVRLLITGAAQPVSQAAAEGHQFYRMHPRLRAVVEEKLRTGIYYRRLREAPKPQAGRS